MSIRSVLNKNQYEQSSRIFWYVLSINFIPFINKKNRQIKEMINSVCMSMDPSE